MFIKSDFYASYLNLININVNPLKVNYFDLEINIIDSKMITTIYDKRRYFEFNIIEIVCWSSNMNKLFFKNIVLNCINKKKTLIIKHCGKKKNISFFFFFFFKLLLKLVTQLISCIPML